ncbi:hypothetical protein OSCI_3860061 [Kamptonema sp. PCC 6506]|nr:hypothetical protein OSCI_3860061 [Kamptonema sp. PCC 6506]
MDKADTSPNSHGGSNNLWSRE